MIHLLNHRVKSQGATGMENVKMLGKISWTILISSLVLMSGCSSSPSREEALQLRGEGVIGKVYYLKHNVYFKGRRSSTLNFHSARRPVRINTPVRILDVTTDAIIIQVKGRHGRHAILNDIAYSNQSIGAIFQRTFSRRPVSSQGLTQLEREMIKKGRISAGMSKRAVVMSYGYPPYYATDSLQSNEWFYPITRARGVNVTFDGEGKASEVSGE